MFHFIFGDAGSGKSMYIYRQISAEAVRDPHRRYFLFVPEQNTLRAQQEIIRHSERHGMLNLDVLSFQLLSYRVMEELGIERPVLLDEISKSILIRKAALEAAPKLQVYGRKIDSRGFIAQLKNLFTEFYQYGIGSEELKRAEEAARGPLLKGKLSDTRLLFEGFNNKLHSGLTVPEEMPSLLLANIARSRLLDDAVIVFDGFTGFTPVQLKLLEFILPKAKETAFSVTIPPEAEPYRRIPGRAGISELYWLSRETVAKVCTAAEKNGVQRSEDVLIDKKKPLPAVTVTAAADPVAEVREAVRSIRYRAVREGLHYRQMAVAVTDPASYREILKREMSKAGIPWFMDDRADALGSPAVELVLAALNVIVDGYSFNSVMRYLRNPLLTQEKERRQQTDRLDNLMRGRGTRGREAMAEALREEELSMEEVFRLHDALKEAPLLSDKTAALKRYFAEAAVDDRIRTLAESLSGRGMERESGEILRVTEQIPLLLERLQAVLGPERISIRDYVKLIEAGFGDMKTGILPARVDMLQIGDLKRSRFDNLSVLYIIGANEGLLPSNVTGGGLFTDREREEMERASLELAPDDKTDSCIQLFYLYMIMNKPDREIVISYAAEDRKAHTLRPSEVIKELKEGRYHGFKAEREIAAGSGRTLPVSYSDALSMLSGMIGQRDPDRDGIRSLTRVLAQDPGSLPRVELILRGAALKHEPERLSETAAARLYPEFLAGSVTRIETFEGCPYSHFLKYGLRLKQRETFDIETLDIGNLFHKALDRVFRMAAGEQKEITQIPDRELAGMCRDAVDTVTADYHDRIMDSSARSRYITARVRRITERTVWALKQQMQKGDYQTLGTEVPFNLREGSLDLHGVIDRVDYCRTGDRTLVRVIDYKTGGVKFDPVKVENGMQLQLVTYMDRALGMVRSRFGEKEEPVPAGMFYYHIADPVIPYKELASGQGAETARLKELRMQGAVLDSAEAAAHLDREIPAGADGCITAKEIRSSGVIHSAGAVVLSEEGFRDMIQKVRGRIREDAGKILKGEISALPVLDGTRPRCEWCSYHGICGFSTQIPGYRFRKIIKSEAAEQ